MTNFEYMKETRAGSGVNKLTLSEDEKAVNIEYTNKFSCRVYIEGDSGCAIIKDILAALQ